MKLRFQKKTKYIMWPQETKEFSRIFKQIPYLVWHLEKAKEKL